MELFIPLYAAMIPFLAWPIEYIIGMPFLVEEVFKATALYLLPNSSLRRKLLITTVCGVLFAFSEGMFYLFKIVDSGDFIQRLALTIPLHTITWITITAFAHINKKLLPVGVAIAVAIHYLYNQYITLLN